MPPAPRGSASGQTFPCPDCDKSFSRKEYMARHYRSKHSKEKPFSDLLRRHYKTCNEAKVARGEVEAPPAIDFPGTAGSSGVDSAVLTTGSAISAPRAAEGSALMAVDAPGFMPYSSDAFLPDGLPVPPMSAYSSAAGSATTSAPQASTSAFSPNMASLFANNAASSSASTASPDYAVFTNSPLSHPSTASTGLTSPDTGAKAALPSSAPSCANGAAQPTSSLSLPQIMASIASATGDRGSAPAMPSLSGPDPSVTEQPHQHPGLKASLAGLGNNDTLAPGLSRTGSFTKDEVLASEVLQDLMRSPFGVNGAGVATMSALGNGANGSHGASPAGSTPWHGAKAAARAATDPNHAQGNESVSLVDTSGAEWAFGTPFASGIGSSSGSLVASPGAGGLSFGGVFSPGPVSNKLEESPAAQALAEYFNKGGVGGITALDLGFPTEPSLWPEWIYQPATVHQEDKRWWLPEQKFCLGYLYPWHVPPLPVLSQYARQATEKLLPSMPIVHAASVVLRDMPAHTAFALTVAGAWYEPEGQAFSNEMLVEKRVFLVRGFQDEGKSWSDKFASLQSLLLYQLLGLFHRDEQQRLLSHSFHSALVYMLRALDVPAKVRARTDELVAPGPSLTGDALEQAWKDWVEVETWRRCAFIVFLTDLEHAAATNSAQLLALSDLDLDLPASDRAWNAKSAIEWSEISTNTLTPPAVSFLAAIRALLAPKTPEPFSTEGVLLNELGRLSSFPLLVLSRTLSYLERKTQEALSQIDPFKSLLGGLGIYEGREQEHRDVLQRIRAGRETLRRLPGGIARGGGEGWYRDIIPSAEDFHPAPSPAPPTTTRASNASASDSTSPSTHSPFTPLDDTSPAATASLSELFAEFDEAPYQPFHGAGGTQPGETYEAAQERLRKLAQRRLDEVKASTPAAFDFMTGFTGTGAAPW
ncbi:hypothetical protein Rhopal_007460-T1 [Rhodotorula paludigena]|uniref:C2H2-type domain-containing protein n=1 Tax=Rhodotorula paludigena TaxID=86838 RepID=A0AAV5GY31_9BASI|nr:hypothetical protein Rhopal_007460-T1 [Rhodotorula paludigena]